MYQQIDDGRLVSFIRDITERKRAEDALYHSEELFRRTFDLSPVCAGMVSLDFRFVRCNKVFCDFWGYPEEEIIGKSFLEFTHPEDRDIGIDEIKKLVAGEVNQVNVVKRYIRKDGKIVWGELNLILLSDDRGKPQLFLPIIIDITERKHAEEELRASEDKFAKAFRSSPQVFSITDLETGRLIEINDSYRSTMGFSREEAIGRTTLELGIWCSAEDRHNFVNELLTNGSVHNIEMTIKNKSGELITILASGELLDIGSKRCMLVSFFDISEQKRAEQERDRLELQLQQAMKLESVGRLAGGVAHDFNNMLGVILGHSELAMSQVDPNLPLNNDLVEIRKSANRSADLTRQLLAFARKQIILPKILDLNETVESTLKMLSRLIGEDIALLWKPGASLWQVRVDPSQIDQILTNLCVNSRDAIIDVGAVTIETTNCVFDEAFCSDHADYLPGEFVMLSVTDNGTGIDKKHQAHIFEPFYDKGDGKRNRAWTGNSLWSSKTE